MNIEPSLITDSQPTIVIEPGKCAFDHPPVPTQPFCALDATPGYTRSDASVPEGTPAPLIVIAFVRMQLGWSLTAASAKLSRLLYRFYRIHNISQSVAVMDVGSSTDYRKGNSRTVDHNMALRARFSFIRRIRPGSFSPFLARTVAESTEARDQSILPASPNLSSSTWCNFSHTPASCQSRNLRQQVTPLPQPLT